MQQPIAKRMTERKLITRAKVSCDKKTGQFDYGSVYIDVEPRVDMMSR